MKHSSRPHHSFFALAALPLAVVCATAVVRGGQAAAAAALSATKPNVTISNHAFHPATLTVRKGATVLWVNKDDDVHTVKSTDGPQAFNSPALDSGNRFTFTFRQAGTYHYICSIHPYMHGVIVVR